MKEDLQKKSTNKSSSWNSPKQKKSSEFDPPSFNLQENNIQAKQETQKNTTQQEIDNITFNQHKFEAFGLQLKEKNGNITPSEQERLGFLRAKMDDFWAQRLQGVSRFSNTSANSTPPIQTRLTIGKPGDKYEQEADRVAAEVVQKLHSPQSAQIQKEKAEKGDQVQTKSADSKSTDLKPAHPLQAVNSTVQRDLNPDGDAASNDFESSLNKAKSGGQPLQSQLRTKMENAMGANFSGVKVHTDNQADQLNRSVQARAFTTGKDVFFKKGEYNPGTKGGQELIAHELTHVVQQNGTGIQQKESKQQEVQQQEIQQQEIQQQNIQTQKENKTGLPDVLKAGVENLSGIAMDDVKVHYNSSEPAKLQASAYTEGTNIHIAPGQEKHLPHEAWHVVQQKQGRVKPSLQFKGINANVDLRLEQEADTMGAKANHFGNVISRLPSSSQVEESSKLFGQSIQPIQRSVVGNPVRQFDCLLSRNNQRNTQQESQEHYKQEVDRTNQNFPASDVPPEYIANSLDSATSKMSDQVVRLFNLVPYDVATVTIWVNSLGKFPRKDLPTVLYHPRAETVMYHTAPTPAAESILQSGLDPRFGGTGGAVGTPGEANAKGYVYLSNDETYARQIASNFFGDRKKYNQGITILKVTVDPTTVFVPDPDLKSAVRTTKKLTNIERYATVDNKGHILEYF